jgi:hypothetical protein
MPSHSVFLRSILNLISIYSYSFPPNRCRHSSSLPFLLFITIVGGGGGGGGSTSSSSNSDIVIKIEEGK